MEGLLTTVGTYAQGLTHGQGSNTDRRDTFKLSTLLSCTVAPDQLENSRCRPQHGKKIGTKHNMQVQVYSWKNSSLGPPLSDSPPASGDQGRLPVSLRLPGRAESAATLGMSARRDGGYAASTRGLGRLAPHRAVAAARSPASRSVQNFP